MTPAIVERTVARRGVAGVLSDAERRTIDALPHERRRRDWLAGRLAAKRVIRAACREAGARVPAYDAIHVWNDDLGAPRFDLDGGEDFAARFTLSIAHADGAAVAALAETAASGTVGVDIERTTSLSLALVRRVMTPAELAALRLPSTAPSALHLWTAKEAAFKAAHRFCAALRHVELSWRHPRTLRARVVNEDAPPHRILVRHRDVGPYTVAFAFCR